MNTIKLHTELNSLLKENKNQKNPRNKKAQQLQIEHENTLIHFLNDSKWKPLILGDPMIQMDKDEVKALTTQLYAHSSSLLAFYHSNQLLMDIIKYGNSSFNWQIAVPAPVYLLPRQVPLLNEYDFLELNKFRRFEAKFEASLQQLDELSAEERAGQILFSAILHGALFSLWKQTALMHADRDKWVVESFASWVELKAIKNSSKKKREEDLCHEDYKTARWFPDPLTEMLIFRWFDDFQDQTCLKGIRRIQSLLFLFLKKIGIPTKERPSSLAALTRWASHAVALRIPPYMHNIAYDKPEATYLSPECWLRMYTEKKVLRYDSATKNKDKKVELKYAEQYSGALVPLTIQSAYLDRIINDLTKPNKTRKIVTENLIAQVNNGSGDSPSFISWLIAAFVLELLQHGGQVKETLTLSTIARYVTAINSPLLNAFADVDACQLSESHWLSHLQDAIDDSDDKMTANRIAEFAAFIQQFDEVPDFDISELEGASINNRVDANLVSYHEFHQALAQIKFGGRLEKMQRLAGVLGFYLGLRSGETTHIFLKNIAGEMSPELLVRSNRYYGTKNRTSRRLPIATLLPATLFHEFMQFYHERIEEEGNKLGDKLLFCYADNSTSPLSYKDLIKPIVDQLKLITGDQTLVYHGLRHSFANNTFLRLLIPELPRLKCLQIGMLNHPCFSLKSCIQLRQRLLPGTEKDSRISVRDTLYQLAMFMGHASPETTIKSYLHLFDWITCRCMGDDNLKLGDNTLRVILKLNTQYWFALKKSLTGNVKNAPLNSDKVLQYVRKKHIGSFGNSMKSKIMKKGRMSNNVSYREMVPSDLIQLLPMLFQKKFTIEEASGRLNISPENVIRIKGSAESLYQVKTRSGRARLPLVPSSLKGRQEHKDLNTMLNKFGTLNSNDKYIHFGLQQFIHGSPSTGMEVKFGTENEVKLYIKFLRKLGMPKNRIILWYYPDPHSTESDRSSVRQAWARTTGIPIDHIFKKPLPRVRHSKNKRNRIGWISVFVRKEKDSPDKSSGVQKALHYLAVFNDTKPGTAIGG